MMPRVVCVMLLLGTVTDIAWTSFAVSENTQEEARQVVEEALERIRQGKAGFEDATLRQWGSSLVSPLLERLRVGTTVEKDEVIRALSWIFQGAQGTERAQIIDVLMAPRDQGYPVIPLEMRNMMGPGDVPAVEPHVLNESFKIRNEAARTLGWIGRNTSERKTRQRIVEVFLTALDHDVASRDVLSWLTYLGAGSEDFSLVARQHISRKLREVSSEAVTLRSPNPEVILMAGYADMRNELPFLKDVIDKVQETTSTGTEGEISPSVWAALRASARMGVDECAKRCVTLTETISDVRRRMRVYEELAYIRHRFLVQQLRPYLDKPEGQIQESRDSLRNSPSQIAASAILKMLENVPVEVAYVPTVPQMIALREWMDKQTSWRFKK